jgi:hypothetical protein
MIAGVFDGLATVMQFVSVKFKRCQGRNGKRSDKLRNHIVAARILSVAQRGHEQIS